MITTMNELDKKFLLAKIRDGKFENELFQTYEYFKKDDNEIKFELYKSIRKHHDLLDIPALAKILSLPEKVISDIFQSNYKVSYFPIYLPHKKEAKVAKMIVVELNRYNQPVVFTYDKEIKSAVETVSKITGKNFFVIFSDNFQHTSFMLSLYAALNYPQEILDKFAFTGIIGIDKDIYDVEAVEEKRKAVKKEGKILISSHEVKEVEELDFWIGRSYIPVPFIQLANKDIEKALKDLENSIKEKERYFSTKNLERIYSIDKNDILLYHPENLPVEEKFWTDYINKDFASKVSSILKKAGTKNVVFHIAVGISALAFGLGVKFGSRQPCVLYHWQKGKDKSYFPVMNLENSETLRSIKEIDHSILENPKYCDIYIPDEKDFSEVAIALHIASHPLYSDVKNYLKANGKNIPVIRISLKEKQGNLPVDEDWKKYVVEINSIIAKLKDNKGIGHIHLFLSVPTVIAFALGMAIGHVVNIPVYSKTSSKEPHELYKKVFETFNIKSPF